jgi:hypothetical protein
MEKCRRVAVYGNSLSMAGIVASLKADPTLEVLCVDFDFSNAWQTLDENDLAAIVYDLSDLPLHLDVTLLRDRPGLLLIGVDPSREEMLVLSSHPSQVHSMSDLVRVIHQREFLSSFFRYENQEGNHQRRFSESASRKE